jgi:uncharacterized membrane protein YoaK (UPF0700 family)
LRDLLGDLRQTLAPPRDGQDGLLPPLLVALTAVTGLVDAFSYLVLDHVFVANMTGNVVFLAFALAGASGFAAPSSLLAIVAFGLGAIAAGHLGSLGSTRRRERLLAATAGSQVVLVVIAVILALLTPAPVPDGYRYALTGLLAVAMGMQNATARKLAVPDLTTTVLTMTITGIAVDSAGRDASKIVRRLVSVAAMLVGACVGAVLALRAHIVYPLVIALVVLAAVAAIAFRTAE